MFAIHNIFGLDSYDFKLPDFNLGFYPTESLNGVEITEFDCCHMDTTSVNCAEINGPEGDQMNITGDDSDDEI
jgi:hypothetical protein